MKTNIKLFGILVLAAVLFSACETKEKEVAVDKDALTAELQAMEDAFAAGQKAKDADAVVAYYSDDAISYGQNEKPRVGKAAIKADMEEGFAKDTLGHYNVYKVVDVFADGDLAVEVGSWTRYDSSGSEVNNGHYMSVFEKRDGKYVCVRDMGSTATPLKKDE
ncbi:YybH family protein [Olleya aquimaris]|uniref:Ketosteroid isomerase-like protein n=1 Tax=Olleya aquimaris TaxID=639310 RepID=A0A327RID9_9FLAO|nr:nuclear transport factor 2 family protein [Olleya aquimaris]RAJ16381.1 ketosteroid isomerase-like protein [Olleya aquimaris]